MIENRGKSELVLNGEFGVRGYDPKTGKELGFCQAFNGRGSPVPDFANGLIYVVNGKPGDIYAVEPGGSGDVTSSQMKWHGNPERSRGRDLPSPAAVGDYVIVVGMSGNATCFDARTGEVYWSEPLGEEGQFAASPLVANGHVYIEKVMGGETVVIKPGKKLNDRFDRTPSGRMRMRFSARRSRRSRDAFMRAHIRTLYCVEG